MLKLPRLNKEHAMSLPSNYEAPEKPSNYLKLTEGTHKFRIMSDIIVGEEWWEEVNGKKTPLRVRSESELPDNVEKSRHFWAMIIWNYTAERIQILNIVQGSLQDAIYDLEHNPDWGDSRGYDITITRTGRSLQDTRYKLTSSPPKPLAKNIQEAYDTCNVLLEDLYEGKDPFAKDDTKVMG
jgi:hypothetical protein